MELAFFTHRTDDATGELAAGAHDVLPRIYRDAGWIVPQLLASLSRADSVYFDTVSQIRMGWWSRGRTVLLGDAAWCVTLFAGSGSSLAVAGADLLGSNLIWSAFCQEGRAFGPVGFAVGAGATAT